jgi:segregation and condensation protein B
MNIHDAKRILETALLCAAGPLSVQDMNLLFDEPFGMDDLRSMLIELATSWHERGVELVEVATGWRFQSRLEMRPYLDRLNPEKPAKYSRAVMETLAIIVYKQPTTRGQIEDIRGVVVSSAIIKLLEERGWIETVGYKEGPGRPALWATTRQFLNDLGVANLSQLPAFDALIVDPAVEASLLEASVAPRLDLPNQEETHQTQTETDDATHETAQPADICLSTHSSV